MSNYGIADAVSYCRDAIHDEGTELYDGISSILDCIQYCTDDILGDDLIDQLLQAAIDSCKSYLISLENAEWNDWYDYDSVDRDTYNFFVMNKMTEEEWYKHNNIEYNEPEGDEALIASIRKKLTEEEFNLLCKHALATVS